MFGNIKLFSGSMKFLRLVPHSNILLIYAFQTICHITMSFAVLLLEIGKFHKYSAVQNNQRATVHCSAEMLCHISITVKFGRTENGYFAILHYFIHISKYMFSSIRLSSESMKFFRILPHSNILVI